MLTTLYGGGLTGQVITVDDCTQGWPAGRGRPQAAARRAGLDPVGKVVTAQQHSMAEADSSKVFVRVPDRLAIPPRVKVKPTDPSG